MGVAILGAMAMNVASHNARMIALRHNEEKKEKTSNPIKKVKEYVEHSKQFADWKKTVEAKVCDDAREIKKLLKDVAGIRECYYIAACNIERTCADGALAEMNASCINHNNYFDEDDWDWYLAASEFLDVFSRLIFKKYGTCYWNKIKENPMYAPYTPVEWSQE